jgi:isoleucyl-tRNA synthetase
MVENKNEQASLIEFKGTTNIELTIKEVPSDLAYIISVALIDEIKWKCKCGGMFRRVDDVLDVWFDSGNAVWAPLTQEEKNKYGERADVIIEGQDQIRGWFYSLLAISTFLFNKQSYNNVLTLGLVLDEENQKMSKSKRNYVDPDIVLNNEGADSLRWYLYSSNAPWMSTRFYEQAVKDTLGKFILTYWNHI